MCLDSVLSPSIIAGMMQKTAAVLIIGNEILSGRIKESNLGFLAAALNECGVKVAHARVIPDNETIIADTVNELRAAYDYVFTTGGIGPTHDDITTASVARAFGVPLLRHAEAEARLRAHYRHDESLLNAARLKMADIPQGATLIDNPVSTAPGFMLGNVFVLAGVPVIMQAMFDNLRHHLEGGSPTLSRSLEINLPEGTVAAAITTIQKDFEKDVEIGIYPLFRQGELGATLVLRSIDAATLSAATHAAMQAVTALGGSWKEI